MIMLWQLNLLKQLEQVDRELFHLPSLELELELESSSSDSEDSDDHDSERDIDSDSEDNSDSDADDELLDAPETLRPPRNADFSGLHDPLFGHRYWQDRSNPHEIHLMRTHTVEQWFHQPHQARFDNTRLFRVHFQMDRVSFERLLELIQDHEVFKNKSHLAKQMHPRYQLAVFLFSMGGKVRSTQLLVASATGVGEGSVRNYCGRVLTAILSLYDKFIHWPAREEKAAMKQHRCAAS
ncbi:Similar to hypothetical protein PGTG_07449 [Puccinia graminis f. sp. tritici CRL 75-36-700-3]; acc. no. XP_003326471 [Pyronema omphalodes CBS 100304]|uniref:Uncharacterized protein n=1 Tax=Pyronema omphalodes (strain CBS 100304) TaxID=1076935 RepID=U4LQ25_PYROM|nr:Similar to hypothetical protein PGTG_07449 [Puccinia graminis f. sp. tritici CRL 75-36-700-3]; acc. no. XP_003326471 [Pyronema omphalodes CBS 100304]